jgi:hypothetical protein
MNVMDAFPSDWPEAVTTIVIGVLSWWLGRKKGEKERRKRPRGMRPPLD